MAAMCASVSARPAAAKLSFKNFHGANGVKAAVPMARAAQKQQAITMAAATLEVKTVDGSAKGSVDLDLKTAGENSLGLVHKYLVITEQNKRRGTASTLTRSEVNGGGKKPYKQKGTGNARVGSKRTPLKPGGGVVFGPKPKDWTITMNKKERRLAMSSALQNAADSIVVVEDLEGKFEDKKTKNMVAALSKLGVAAGEKAVLCVKELSEGVKLSGRNIAGLKICTLDSLTIYDVLNAEKLVFDEASIAKANELYSA